MVQGSGWVMVQGSGRVTGWGAGDGGVPARGTVPR